MHIHISATTALLTFASVAVVGFFWRLLAFLWRNNAIGQAMAFIY